LKVFPELRIVNTVTGPHYSPDEGIGKEFFIGFVLHMAVERQRESKQIAKRALKFELS